MVLCYGGGLAGGLRVGRRKVAEGGGQRPGEQGSRRGTQERALSRDGRALGRGAGGVAEAANGEIP